MFERLTIQKWRQFGNIDIAFHKNLTVITGANGAGKTTVLSMLSRHFGWNVPLASTPRKASRGLIEYFTDSRKPAKDSVVPGKTGQAVIGQVHYTANQAPAHICVPHQVQQQYNLHIDKQQAVPGIYISSHRPLYFYQQVQTIPAKLDAKNQLLDKYLNELKQRYNQNAKNTSASFRIKEAIISLATFGYGNVVVTRDDEAVAMFEGFEAALRTILPTTLGFQKIVIHMPEVVLETKTGSFSFDSASGGIASLIDLTWQIYMASVIYGKFTVVMDEPENHLHPKLQKTLMPSLIEAFPQVQFIIATHNPFMVTSVPDSNVYVLDYNDENEVESSLLDMINKSGSSNDTLRSVLGLESTLPVWAESKLNQVIQKYLSAEMNRDSLNALKTELQDIGFGDFFPEAIKKVSERLK